MLPVPFLSIYPLETYHGGIRCSKRKAYLQLNLGTIADYNDLKQRQKSEPDAHNDWLDLEKASKNIRVTMQNDHKHRQMDVLESLVQELVLPHKMCVFHVDFMYLCQIT